MHARPRKFSRDFALPESTLQLVVCRLHHRNDYLPDDQPLLLRLRGVYSHCARALLSEHAPGLKSRARDPLLESGEHLVVGPASCRRFQVPVDETIGRVVLPFASCPTCPDPDMRSPGDGLDGLQADSAPKILPKLNRERVAGLQRRVAPEIGP